MHDLTPLIRSDSQVIQGYKGGVFRVSGQRYDTPILVFSDHVQIWNFEGLPEYFSMEDFQDLIALSETLDIVLLGTGDKSIFFPQGLRRDLKAKGVDMDVMDTSAACRTYNVLMAEGRRVAAALLPAS